MSPEIKLYSTAEWQSLIQETAQAHRIELSEDLESYLVFMLMRYLKHTELVSSILACEFLSSLQQTGKLRELNLQQVGDKCLLFSGLFPEQALRRRVPPSYFTEIGQSSYQALSNTRTKLAALFTSLAYNFTKLSLILQGLSQTADPLKTSLANLIDLAAASQIQSKLVADSRLIIPTSKH